VFLGGHIAATWWVNMTEQYICGGNAPYVKLLSPLVIFGIYTDSRALRAEYCIVGIPHNTAI